MLLQPAAQRPPKDEVEAVAVKVGQEHDGHRGPEDTNGLGGMLEYLYRTNKDADERPLCRAY